MPTKMKRAYRLNMIMSDYGCHKYVENRIFNPILYNRWKLLREKLTSAVSSLYQGDLKAHYGCVNAIEFSNNGGHMIASENEYIVGGDDRRVLLWNTQKAMWRSGSPSCMKSEHRSNIFCIAFDKDNEKIFSGGNDEQVFVHDAATGKPLDNFMHEDAVYGLSTDPNNSHVFASACDDGRVLIYDIREPADSEPFCLANYVSSMHSVMFNPVEPRLLATANAREGIGLWDVRKPKSCLMRYGGEFEQQSCMSVRINSLGTQLLALRRRLPPVIYNIDSGSPIVEFDHTGYFNSCTMKSCCFAGDKDQYVLSGSDDFNVYMWALPDDLTERQFVNSAHLVLKGHRSIVNQVRYNIDNALIISSGVEKTIKAWSPFPLQLPETYPEPLIQSNSGERAVYTHEEYINLVLRTGHVMSHDYTHLSMEEDPRMMAFFDSLVQRELETWSSSEEFSSNEEELYDRILQVSQDSPDLVHPGVQEELDSDISNDEFSPFTLAFASIMAARTDEQGGESRLLNVEESTDTENIDANTDNEEISNRRSISDIIAENKKETLLKNIEMRKKQISTKVKQSIKRQIVSDTESDDELISGKTEKLRKVSTEQGECSTGINNTSQNFKKVKVRFQLKKLRALRSQILNSDSDSNDYNPSTTEVKLSAEQTSSSASSCRMNSGKGSEYGPYLQAASESLIPRCYENLVNSNANNNNTSGTKYNTGTGMIESCNNIEKEEPKPSCSGHDNTNNDAIKHKQFSEQSSNSTNLHSNPNDSQQSNPSLNNVKCKSKAKCTNTLTNGRDEPSTSSNSLKFNNVKSSETAPSSGVINNCDKEPTWNEFKRYKRTLERASRYYRRHSGSQPSSDDDI